MRILRIAFLIVAVGLSIDCQADVVIRDVCTYFERNNALDEDAKSVLTQFRNSGAVKVCQNAQRTTYFTVSPIVDGERVRYFGIDRIIKDESNGEWKYDVPSSISYVSEREIYMCFDLDVCPSYDDFAFVRTRGVPVSAFANFNEVWTRLSASRDEFNTAFNLARMIKTARNDVRDWRELVFGVDDLTLTGLFLNTEPDMIVPHYEAVFRSSSNQSWIFIFDFVRGSSIQVSTLYGPGE